jgi:hypothetical protein
MGNDRRDQATRSVDCWEGALCVRTAIVAQQIVELKAAANDLSRDFWPVGEFASIDDVTSYMSREVGRVNAGYRAQRRGTVVDDEQALQAVIDAEAAVDAIGRESAVVAFLVKGASVAAARFKVACRMLMALLDVSPDADAALEGRADMTTRTDRAAWDNVRVQGNEASDGGRC